MAATPPLHIDEVDASLTKQYSYAIIISTNNFQKLFLHSRFLSV